MTTGTGIKDDPWILKTPPGTSEYTMYRDDAADPPVIVCQVGGTKLFYDARAIADLHAMLKTRGDWMPLGGADEQKPAPDGSVEAWGRSTSNPVGGWYGLKKGLRARPSHLANRTWPTASGGCEPARIRQIRPDRQARRA
jgi:hypothetical protein